MIEETAISDYLSEPVPESRDDYVRVLLIEDDPATQHLCKRYLDNQEGMQYQLTATSTASEGLSTCQLGSFDCILVDYNLPDSNGTLVIRYLDHLLTADSPPAIIITSDESQHIAAEAVRAGAADFIPKRALSARSLCRAIDNAVEKSRLKTAVNDQSKKLLDANKVLKKKNEEIQNFYQGVSHEVKTPLTAAREFISLVKDGIPGPVNEEQTQLLKHAISSCDQINDHFNDLLEITRLDAGKVVLEKEFSSLDDVAIRSIASVAQSLTDKNIDLIHEVEKPIPPIQIDVNRIVQVLANLLHNAIKFSENDSKIVLSIFHVVSEATIHVSVCDEGCGISGEDVRNIFDRLFQSESGAGRDLEGSGGLGLGLSIAKEIIELHDGKIWVKSTEEKGSTFTFSIPIAHPILN